MNVLSFGTTSTRQGRAQYELRIGAFVERELEVVSFEGHEKLSTPYVYDVVFASSIPVAVLETGVFGFPACLSIRAGKHEPRRCVEASRLGPRWIFSMPLKTETPSRQRAPSTDAARICSEYYKARTRGQSSTVPRRDSS
jgi:hypothetical protein